MASEDQLVEHFGGAVAAPRTMNPSVPTVVAFGGLHQQIGMPPFEFFRLLSDWDVNTIFVRDLSRTFYQSRIVRGNDLPLVDLAVALQNFVPPGPPSLLVGTSAGGYAALAASAVTGMRALAIAPVTTLRLRARVAMLDKRWRRPMWDAGKASRAWPEQREVARFMESHGRADARVYFPAANRLDRCHARRIESVAGVTLHEVDSRRHEVIREMRDTGQLTLVMKNLLTP